MVIFLLYLISFSAMAQIKGVISVLEAPLFEKADQNSKVIQYLQKGELIYIHPKHTRSDKFKTLIDLTEKVEEKSKIKYQKEFSDDFFNEENKLQDQINENYFLTLDNQGNEAYVLKSHVFVYYKDLRELNQQQLKFDPTDYRLAEPLPKAYPLIFNNRTRGQINFGIKKSANQIYPFPETLKDQDIKFETEFNLVWLNHVNWNEDLRLFFGGILFFNSFDQNLILENSSVNDKSFKIGLGPYISYDLWRNHSYRFNIYNALTFNLLNERNISISSDINSDSLQSVYKANNIEYRIGANFQIQDVLSSADFSFGINSFLQIPYQYEQSSSSGTNNTFNNDYNKKSFEEPFQMVMSFSIGLQDDF